MAKWMAAS
jgi:hypothetical protein